MNNDNFVLIYKKNGKKQVRLHKSIEDVKDIIVSLKNDDKHNTISEIIAYQLTYVPVYGEKFIP